LQCVWLTADHSFWCMDPTQMRVPNAGVAKASLPCFCSENVAENQFTPVFHSVLSWDRHFFSCKQKTFLARANSSVPFPSVKLDLDEDWRTDTKRKITHKQFEVLRETVLVPITQEILFLSEFRWNDNIF